MTLPTLPSNDIAYAVQDKVDAFVRAHFHLAATLKLHRAALGWDLLRAPVNVALAPVFMLVGLTGGVARLVGFHRVSAWLRGRADFSENVRGPRD